MKFPNFDQWLMQEYSLNKREFKELVQKEKDRYKKEYNKELREFLDNDEGV